MESFADLGLAPPLVEALASEGIEHPTALQVDAIPVLRRGNSAVLRGGPGSGALVAYGAALLDRYDPNGNQPRALVFTTSREEAGHLAISLARLAVSTEHQIGALGVPWALPERSDILFATPMDLDDAVRTARIKLDQVTSVVLNGASHLLEMPNGDILTSILQGVDAGSLQFALVGDPLTPTARRFVEDHVKRAVFLPPEAQSAETEESAVQRGTIRFRSVEGVKEAEASAVVQDLLEEGFRHVLIFLRSESRAADLGDLLTLHGFVAGAPGDSNLPVWLGTEGLVAREAIRSQPDGSSPEVVATVSIDVPPDPDELDRRHGGGTGGGVVLAYPRELPHLRRIASEAGYTLEPLPSPPRSRTREDEATTFLAELERTLEEEDLVPYIILLEPLIRRQGAAEVAAALAAILRRKVPRAGAPGAAGDMGTQRVAGPGMRPPAWVRIFMSVGERDGVRPGDLLGAIIGEAGVAGDQVGRIDLRDTFARVEIQEIVAERVIRAMNGTSIRGRSVRVDYDRGEGRPTTGGVGPRSPASSAGPKKGGRRPGPGDGGSGGRRG